jgi:indole-3-glycerol phosphate synthase
VSIAPPASADLLAAIVASTRRSLSVRSEREPLAALARRAEATTMRPGAFRAALSRDDRLNVIAECKRRSPSRGVLRRDYDPVLIARAYEQGGAAAISVLTEPTFFDGALEHLAAVREAVTVPVLRKDFIVSEYQLFEARAAKADAVLLIVAALTADELRSLSARAASLDLDTLVEVHDDEELKVAIDCGAPVVGVNNRNLRTLAVDVTASERLVAQIPAGTIAVSESGLTSGADLRRLARLGYRGFLVGERLMTDSSPGAALGALLIEASCS